MCESDQNDPDRNVVSEQDLFHEDADGRLAFLSQLHQDGHDDEALTLCLCYIDSFSQLICWPSKRPGKNFVDAMSNFGDDPTIGLVHPLQAVREFKRMKPFWNQLAIQIEALFPGPDYELLTKDDLLDRLQAYLSSNAISRAEVMGELWHGTIAAIAYYHFRNPAIHGFGAGPDRSFSRTTYQDRQVPNIGFDRFYLVALNLHAELRRRSQNTGQFCGNDAML